MTPKWLLLNILLLSSLNVKAQNKTLRFNTFSFGLGINNFRDFATSPLIYKGNVLQFSTSNSKYFDNKWREYGIVFSSGELENNFNNHPATSQLNQFSGYYSKLYPIRWKNNAKYIFHAGGMFKVDTNIRNNPTLGNTAVGIEAFPTLFGSVLATADITRKEAKHKNIWFIKYRLLPAQQELRLRFNLGLVNGIFRNPYSYLPHSALRNTGGYLDDYNLTFSGFRFRSAIHYDRILSNKNRIRTSYTWELWTTPKEHPNRFEMAQHSLRFTYLFHIPNRK